MNHPLGAGIKYGELVVPPEFGARLCRCFWQWLKQGSIHTIYPQKDPIRGKPAPYEVITDPFRYDPHKTRAFIRRPLQPASKPNKQAIAQCTQLYWSIRPEIGDPEDNRGMFPQREQATSNRMEEWRRLHNDQVGAPDEVTAE